MKSEFLVNLAKMNCRQGWVGDRAPFRMESIDLLNSTNYRVSATLHGSFGIVWLYEDMLGDMAGNGWKIAVDECIRLLKREGHLVIRNKECSKVTIVGIKNFIGRRFGLSVSIDYEEFDKKELIYTVCFSITRQNYDIYKSNSWTFAVLTTGKRKENVIKFLKSIREQEGTEKSQIIISGPTSEEYNRYDVEYLDLSPFRDNDYAEISRKKNEIARIAAGDNLLIAHDRYVLNSDFFAGFDNYGYDFDFLTIKQYYQSGKEFPSYCCVGQGDFLWSYPYTVENYNYLYNTQYLNGGLLIFKTAALRQIGFNGLLMWQQQEDVEISKVFMNWGIVPRINWFSSATTIGISEEYIKGFKTLEGRLPPMPTPMDLVYGYDKGTLSVPMLSKIAKVLPPQLKNTRGYQFLKRIVQKMSNT